MSFNINSKILHVTLMAIATIIAAIGFKLLMAGFYTSQTNFFLNNWEQKQVSPNTSSIQVAMEASHKSKYWYPTENATLEENVGKVHQWKTYLNTSNEENLKEERLIALKAYRNQTAITPSWPKAWFNLLSIKIELDEFDDEFYQAYEEAKKTTNQTPRMQTDFTLVSIQSWYGVNNKTKSEILKNIVREASSSQKNSQNLKTLLEAYNLQQITCAYALAIKANTYELCK